MPFWYLNVSQAVHFFDQLQFIVLMRSQIENAKSQLTKRKNEDSEEESVVDDESEPYSFKVKVARTVSLVVLGALICLQLIDLIILDKHPDNAFNV